MSSDDRDDAAVLYNIKKATKAWYGMQCILSAHGADPRTMARFYLAVVQAKLLFGSEIWVLSERLEVNSNDFMLDVLGQSHIDPFDLSHPDGTWEHPPNNLVLADCGLSPIATYMVCPRTSGNSVRERKFRSNGNFRSKRNFRAHVESSRNIQYLKRCARAGSHRDMHAPRSERTQQTASFRLYEVVWKGRLFAVYEGENRDLKSATVG